MKILVVYDSYFGNTEQIAQEIGRSFGDDIPVRRPNDVDMGTLSSLDLLIVGAPTRAFRPSEAIKAFLKEIPNDSLNDVKVAAFDTRIEPEDIGNPILKFMANTFGYAAEPIAKGLVRKRGVQVGEPIGFVVMDSEGPLREGELERAADWVETLLD
jgi:flavodoxin